MDREQVIKELKVYKRKVAKKIAIDRMILFGSVATGKIRKDSDVDLLVISSKFKDQNASLRPILFYKEWNLDYPVDILCYTPEEIKNREGRSWGVVREALDKGIVI